MLNNEKREKQDFLFNIDFVQYVDILKKQKGFIIVFFLSAVLTSLALTYILSEKFEAATTIYYRPVESSLLKQKSTEAFGAPIPAAPFKIIYQSLQDILSSPLILEPVVLKLKLHEGKEVDYSTWYERWFYAAKNLLIESYTKSLAILQYGRTIEEDSIISAMRELRDNIDITTTKDSYVYILKVQDKNNKRAEAIVNETGKRMVEWMLDQDKNQAKERSEQYLQQLTLKNNVIDALRNERESLLNKYDIVSVPEEIGSGTQSLYKMQHDLVQLIAQIDEKTIIISKLEEELKNKLSTNPDDFKKMESEKLFKKIELNGLIAKKDSLLSSIEGLKVKLRELPSVEKAIDNIDSILTSELREHELFKDLYLEAITEVHSFQSQIRMLHPAISSAAPVQPIKVYHVGLSAVLSLFLGVGLVYAFAFFNVRIFFASQGIKGRKQINNVAGSDSNG